MTEKSEAQIFREAEQEAYDSALVVTYCSFCPQWFWQGPARDAREVAREHREKEHPEHRQGRRGRKHSLGRWIQRDLDHEEWEEINAERRRRAVETGVLLED